MIDVVNKLCEFEGCTCIPQYNYIGEKKAVFCRSHKLENMINVNYNFIYYFNILKLINYYLFIF
jgi:hypothetical protein